MAMHGLKLSVYSVIFKCKRVIIVINSVLLICIILFISYLQRIPNFCHCHYLHWWMYRHHWRCCRTSWLLHQPQGLRQCYCFCSPGNFCTWWALGDYFKLLFNLFIITKFSSLLAFPSYREIFSELPEFLELIYFRI